VKVWYVVLAQHSFFARSNGVFCLPAVDHGNKDQFVFETGAIMWYLCEKEAKGEEFWPKVRNPPPPPWNR